MLEAVAAGLGDVEAIRVARALDDCRSFLSACTTSPRVYPIDSHCVVGDVGCGVTFQARLRALCSALDVSLPAFCTVRPTDATSLDIGLSRFLALDRLAWGGDSSPPQTDALAAALRASEPPIIARIRDGALLLDPRTLTDEEAQQVAGATRTALDAPPGR